jgi:hypothetical protein
VLNSIWWKSIVFADGNQWGQNANTAANIGVL